METLLQPLDDRLVVQREAAEEKSKGGIILAECAKEKPNRGTILAAGPNATATPGQVVVFSAYAGFLYKEGGEELVIVKQAECLAILKPAPPKADPLAEWVTTCAVQNPPQYDLGGEG